MTIQELGSVGELVAAIATIGTLIYLALQLRRNTQSLRSSNLQEIQRDIRSVLLSSVEATDIATRYHDGETLSASERMFLIQRYMGVFRVMETIWYQSDKDTLDPVLLEGYMHHMRVILSSELAIRLWNGYEEGVFHPGFVSYTNEYLKRNPPFRPNIFEDDA